MARYLIDFRGMYSSNTEEFDLPRGFYKKYDLVSFNDRVYIITGRKKTANGIQLVCRLVSDKPMLTLKKES